MTQYRTTVSTEGRSGRDAAGLYPRRTAAGRATVTAPYDRVRRRDWYASQ